MNRFFLIVLLLCSLSSFAQEGSSMASLKVRVEVSQRGVVKVRWAPTTPKAWKLLNEYGVRVERDLVYSGGKVLDEPQRDTLATTLRPDTTEHFKEVAQRYDYGAIIAQAVFGSSFELTGSGNSISSMIAQSEDIEQRFTLSLYAADLCFEAAVAVGWGFVDNGAKEGNKYLYRVVSLVPESELSIDVGVALVSPSELTKLVAPLDFRAEFLDSTAILRWNYRTLDFIYNSYMPERSVDGVNFSPISQLPITKLGETSKGGDIIYMDEIENFERYYYRLRGITPFSTYGAYSDTITGVAFPELKTAPIIVSLLPDESGGADMVWSFDMENEKLVESFTIEHSVDNKHFEILIDEIDFGVRSYKINNLKSSNYFVVTANSITGTRKRSQPAFIQASDSIPPAVPVGLQAIVDTSGLVHISWQPNSDEDIYGYRLYRGQTKGEELIVLNDIAIKENSYVDSVSVRNLNSKIYYSLTALDERYNQSAQCEIIEVMKPDLIPPTPPYITNVVAENGKNIISWVSGGEDNLGGYSVYRDTVQIASIEDAQILVYEDTEIENGKDYEYRLYSWSIGGLVSQSSQGYSVNGVSIGTPKRSGSSFSVVAIDDAALLKWNVKGDGVRSIDIYKKADDEQYTLLKSKVTNQSQLEDASIIPLKVYSYMLVVKYDNLSPLTIIKPFQL